jgi:hypothetical protein
VGKLSPGNYSESDWGSIDLSNKADSRSCERGVKGIGALRVVRTRRLHSVPSWREYELEPREIPLEGDDPVEVQSWQDYYREKWRS